MAFDFGGLYEAVGIVITLSGQQWILHRQNQKENEKRDLLLQFLLGEYPPHSHVELGDAVLTADGIKYPKAKVNGVG